MNHEAILELLELSERMRSRLVLRSCISNHEWSRVADEIEGIAQSMVDAPIELTPEGRAIAAAYKKREEEANGHG